MSNENDLTDEAHALLNDDFTDDFEMSDEVRALIEFQRRYAISTDYDQIDDELDELNLLDSSEVTDEHLKAIRAIAGNWHISSEAVDVLLDLSSKHQIDIGIDLALNRNLTLEQQVNLAASADIYTLRCLAHNPSVSPITLEMLAHSVSDVEVQKEILASPACTPAIRQIIDPAVVEAFDKGLARTINETSSFSENDWEFFETGVHPSIDLAAVLNTTLSKEWAIEYSGKDGLIGQLATLRLGNLTYDFQQVEGWDDDEDSDD